MLVVFFLSLGSISLFRFESAASSHFQFDFGRSEREKVEQEKNLVSVRNRFSFLFIRVGLEK
jgi:hypothetical protein